MHISKDYIIREIVGEYIIVPTGKAAMNVQGLITLNETGVFLWQELQKKDMKNEELIESLCEEYEVDLQTAAADVKEFLDHIRKHEGILEERSQSEEVEKDNEKKI